MRNCVALLSLLLFTAVIAQDVPKPAEPQYVDSFFFLQADATLKPLEPEKVFLDLKLKALGYGGLEFGYPIQNEHSPVRVSGAAIPPIIVKLWNGSTDPANVVSLYLLRSGNGKRGLPLVSSHLFGAKNEMRERKVPLRFAKYGEASTMVAPQSPLSPGEYAILMDVDDSSKPQAMAFCFGVDAVN